MHAIFPKDEEGVMRFFGVAGDVEAVNSCVITWIKRKTMVGKDKVKKQLKRMFESPYQLEFIYKLAIYQIVKYWAAHSDINTFEELYYTGINSKHWKGMGIIIRLFVKDTTLMCPKCKYQLQENPTSDLNLCCG